MVLGGATRNNKILVNLNFNKVNETKELPELSTLKELSKTTK